MYGTITIVDDCEELRFLLVLLLEQSFSLRCLSLGSLAEVQRHREEVLASRAAILDINLGSGRPDGVAVYRWLLKNGYRGQVFFFTGHAKNSPFLAEAERTGVPILEKPMELEELLPVLEQSIAIPPRATA